MPTAIPLRAAPPERTPERAKLAAEIERHAAASDRLRRTRAALEKVYRLAVDATAAVDAAERRLAEARDESPQAWVSHLVGDVATAPRTVEDAEAALAAARANDETVHRNQAALQNELRRVEREAETAGIYLKQAVDAVVAKSAETAALLGDFASTRNRLDELATILNELGPLRLPPSGRDWAARLVTEDDARDTALLAATAPWSVAIAALQTDADAALPGNAG